MSGLQSKFKTPEGVIKAYSPPSVRNRMQELGLRSLKEIVAYDAPMLVHIAGAFGIVAAENIIRLYVVNLMDTINVQRFTDDQVAELSYLLYTEQPVIKVTELHEFFRRVKSGYYGEMYGSIDCMKVMADFRQFQGDLSHAKRRVAQEAEERERRLKRARYEQDLASGKLITREQFRAMKPKVKLSDLGKQKQY